MQATVIFRKLNLLQAVIWLVFYSLLLLYSWQKWEKAVFAFGSATIAVVSYIIVVYANTYWLLPQWYQRGRRMSYLLGAFFVLTAVVAARMAVEYLLLFPIHHAFYNWSIPHASFVCLTIGLAFVAGILLRVSIDYVRLLYQQEASRNRHLQSEIALLKAQVQPHFLFNTLNNIYYLALTKSDRAPLMISKLSSIMRYFVDEAPKEKVRLRTEIEFISNYIALEQIRMPDPVRVEFQFDGIDEDLEIPPMLLIPLVENIFKHGIDKTLAGNRIRIDLRLEGGRLVFATENPHPVKMAQEQGQRSSGKGLNNLERRMTLLFGDDYRLSREWRNQTYFASLQIPVS